MMFKRRYHRLRTDRIAFGLAFTALFFLGVGACIGLATAPTIGEDAVLASVLEQSQSLHAEAAKRISELRAQVSRLERGEGLAAADPRALARLEELERSALVGPEDRRVLAGFAPTGEARLVSVLGDWVRELALDVRFDAAAVDRRVDLSRLPPGSDWGAIKRALYEQGLLLREGADRCLNVERRFSFR